jgi:hypothetical protein
LGGISVKLRAAIVGCGQIAANAHAPFYKSHPDVEIIAVVDPELDRAAALAERFNIPHHFSKGSSILTSNIHRHVPRGNNVLFIKTDKSYRFGKRFFSVDFGKFPRPCPFLICAFT